MTGLQEHRPYISVCIPVRNGEREIAHTLSNLLAQTGLPRSEFELVIGDHGSTDGTKAIVDEHARVHPNVRRIDVPFTSANRAFVRNRTIQAARGELLIFIDHDILAGRSFLRAHADAHAAADAALVVGETYGKGIYKRDIDESLQQLDLDDITASRVTLASDGQFSDARNRLASLPSEEQLIDLTEVPAPFRFGWSCNISAKRSDIEECGLFDERYVGWGCEDDDFTQQFRVKKRSLLFSRDAWAFHIPHPVDTASCLVSWRNNFETFFEKFPTREVEYYSLYGHEIDAGIRRLEGVIQRHLSILPVEARRTVRVPPRSGKTRLCHFVSDLESASHLGLTHALDPTLPLTLPSREAGGIRFSSCLGLRTPFGAAEIDEVLILADEFMYLDRPLATLLLTEAARISRRVLVHQRPTTPGPTEQLAREALRALIGLTRFHEVQLLESN